MVVFWYSELENKFPDIKCHEMVVMPDHFHCIIENTGSIAQGGVGADLCVCAYPCAYPDILNYPEQHDHLCDHNYRGEHKGSPLWRVIQWFKTMTTNEYIRGVKNYGWQRFENKLWQRNYWERIIRTENDMNRISEYIVNNPKNWIVKNNL